MLVSLALCVWCNRGTRRRFAQSTAPTFSSTSVATAALSPCGSALGRRISASRATTRTVSDFASLLQSRFPLHRLATYDPTCSCCCGQPAPASTRIRTVVVLCVSRGRTLLVERRQDAAYAGTRTAAALPLRSRRVTEPPAVPSFLPNPALSIAHVAAAAAG